jgi:hypothetical protein
LLDRFDAMAMRAIKDINVGQIPEVDVTDKPHRAATVRALQSGGLSLHRPHSDTYYRAVPSTFCDRSKRSVQSSKQMIVPLTVVWAVTAAAAQAQGPGNVQQGLPPPTR